MSREAIMNLVIVASVTFAPFVWIPAAFWLRRVLIKREQDEAHIDRRLGIKE